MHQAQSAMNQGQSGTQVGIEEDEMLKRLIELSKHQDGGLTMLQRDLLVTRFLVEEQRKLLHQAGDTQSLPGGTCAATQTDATKGKCCIKQETHRACLEAHMLLHRQMLLRVGAATAGDTQSLLGGTCAVCCYTY